jgi:hypothetical protein
VQNAFFNDLFHIYKDHAREDASLYAIREVFANVWVNFIESIEKGDLNTAYKQLEKVNKMLKDYKGQIVWQEVSLPFGN